MCLFPSCSPLIVPQGRLATNRGRRAERLPRLLLVTPSFQEDKVGPSPIISFDVAHAVHPGNRLFDRLADATWRFRPGVPGSGGSPAKNVLNQMSEDRAEFWMLCGARCASRGRPITYRVGATGRSPLRRLELDRSCGAESMAMSQVHERYSEEPCLREPRPLAYARGDAASAQRCIPTCSYDAGCVRSICWLL